MKRVAIKKNINLLTTFQLLKKIIKLTKTWQRVISDKVVEETHFETICPCAIWYLWYYFCSAFISCTVFSAP